MLLISVKQVVQPGDRIQILQPVPAGRRCLCAAELSTRRLFVHWFSQRLTVKKAIDTLRNQIGVLSPDDRSPNPLAPNVINNEL